MDSITFTLNPLPPFRLDLTVWVLRRRPDNLLDRWDGSTYQRVLALRNGVALAAVRQTGSAASPELQVTLSASHLEEEMTREAATTLEMFLQPVLDEALRRDTGVYQHRCNNSLEGNGSKAMIQIKRVYDQPDIHDGKRFLVERLWPRGIKKENLPLDGWLKDVAPSNDLRKWFGHDPDKWEDFQNCYIAELEKNHNSWQPLLDASLHGTVTLIYSSHDQEHNNALVLKNFLAGQIKE